jgi:hypothetical protein
LILLILFTISDFFRIKLALLVVDDLLKGFDLIFKVLLLILIEFVEIIDVSSLLL